MSAFVNFCSQRVFPAAEHERFLRLVGRRSVGSWSQVLDSDSAAGLFMNYSPSSSVLLTGFVLRWNWAVWSGLFLYFFIPRDRKTETY